jgi:S1-C subfamily serine protease
MKRTLVIVLAAAFGGGLAGAAVGLALDDGHATLAAAASTTAAPTQISSRTQGAGLIPEEIYRRAAPSVVVITDTQTEIVPPTFFTPRTKEHVSALGSGFVIDRQGDIVTNDHVVQGASQIRVGFSSGKTYPATVVGTDPSTDVAVVRVKAPTSALKPLAFAESSTTSVGDAVYAIGNPFGLDRTMTAGIVSATGRDIESPNGLTIANAIQTDAPINHGNSGGPLLDRFGRVLGINAQIEGGTVDGNVGVGFAIPSNTAKSVAEQLIASGHARHAWFGVQVETIDPDVAKVLRGLPSHGVVITKVFPGSPAARAGLKAANREVTVNGVSTAIGGDVIVRLDGKPLSSSSQLAGAVALRKPGETLRLTVARSGVVRNVAVTLGNVPKHT